MGELAGKNVLVLGLGVNQGGSGVARYLVGQGANVRVTDMLPEDRLAGSLAALDGLPIGYTLGGHDPADIEWADIVVRNPGVPRQAEMLRLSVDLGKQIEMEMTLFFRACPAPIIGVTGTKGKTTTTHMIATLLRQSWSDARLAGNMGRSAVMELDELDASVPVVIELSSFQIEGLGAQRLSPRIAVFTNLAEDHLDRYESFDHYSRTKAALAEYQRPDDWLIFNRDDSMLSGLLQGMPGQVVTFGRQAVDGSHVFWIEEGRFRGRWDGAPMDFGAVGRVKIPGEHAQLNALAAIAAATAAGVPAELIRAGLAEIAAVPDRMERVATVDGVEYVNDTTATIPAAAIAALRSFPDREVIVIAGGSEKHVSLKGFAAELAARAGRSFCSMGAQPLVWSVSWPKPTPKPCSGRTGRWRKRLSGRRILRCPARWSCCRLVAPASGCSRMSSIAVSSFETPSGTWFRAR
ncbi:MAG: UDP-N-acetylmuramoyl-L-alanine--D-glutamate ligase [Thermomicrobiales bacterium]